MGAMSDPAPCLETDRLRLRPFTLADAPEVQRLAGDQEVASTTLAIPHPYEDGMAEGWIAAQAEDMAAGRSAHFAITLASDGRLIGAISLLISKMHEKAELGYWVGKPLWGQGFCTEAGHAVVAYGFETLKLHLITSRHLTRNPASGRVMQKLGMTWVGRERQAVKKWGVFEDLEVYSLLGSDWLEARSPRSPLSRAEGVEIRPVQLGDEPGWIRMRRALWPEAAELPGDLEGEVADFLSGDRRHLEAHGLQEALVAQAPDGQLCGFIELSLRNVADGCSTSPVGYIEGWYVDDAYRRQGVGRMLVEAGEDWARGRGCREMGSDVETHDAASLLAHSRLGYQEISRVVTYAKALEGTG